MIQDYPQGNKLTGIYRGKVICHLPHGKLKVFIPTVYAAEWETHPEMLPDAEQLTPLFAGCNQGNGVFSYPNIGSIVMCQFINGDQNYPIVIGATLGGPNAFGQYSHIFLDKRDENNNVLSTDILDVNHSSPSHLITSGKTHLRLFEDGCISAITMTPNDVPIGVDFKKNELSNEFTKHNIDSQIVMSNRGEISASTVNHINKIHSDYIANINGNIHIDTYSPQITCYIDMKSQGSIEIETVQSDARSKIQMMSNGNIIIDSTTQIQLHAKNIKINADTQLDIITPQCTITDSVAFNVKAPTINLDSSEGSTIIKTKSGTTFFS